MRTAASFCRGASAVALLCACVLLRFEKPRSLRTAYGARSPIPWSAAAASRTDISTSGGLSGSNWRGCRVPRGRKFAIYQPRAYHSEVFGVLLAYAKACGHSMPVFYDMQYDELSALPYYDWLYGPVEKRPKDDFVGAVAGLDAAFFTTPEIPTSNGEGWHKSNAHRFIYISHLLSHPSYNKEYMVLRLHMTPLVAGPPFALPVYPPPDLFGETGTIVSAKSSYESNAVAKKETGQPPSLTISNARPLSAKRLVMIGMMWDGDNYKAADILAIAAALAPHGWRFDVYGREWKVPPGTTAPGNMVFHANRPTEEVISAAQEATFLLIYPSATSWYVTDRMTGGLPLAISQGAPILTTIDFAAVYGLDRSTGVLAASSTDEAVKLLLSTGEVEYKLLLRGISAFRLRAWVHAVHSLENLLLAVPSISLESARHSSVYSQESNATEAKPNQPLIPMPAWLPLSMPLRYPRWNAGA